MSRGNSKLGSFTWGLLAGVAFVVTSTATISTATMWWATPNPSFYSLPLVVGGVVFSLGLLYVAGILLLVGLFG